MAKFSSYRKLSKEQRQQVLLELCQALVMVKKLSEAAKLLGDLLSDQEIEMIGKRLQVAKLLLNKKTYQEIGNELKVSYPTIARVSLWLDQAGDGFRMVMSRGLMTKNLKIPEWMPQKHWSSLQRNYPLESLPRRLLDEIIRTANNRQRKRLLGTLQILREAGKGKRQTFNYLEGLLLKEKQIRKKINT